MTAIMWPTNIGFSSIPFTLENQSRGGGPSISGREQIVSTPSARWTARGEVLVGGRSQMQTMRSVLSRLDGRANTILLGPCEPNWSPSAVNGGTALVETTHSDGTTFSDGTTYSQDGTFAYFVNAQEAQDTVVVIHCEPALDLTYFSVVPAAPGEEFTLHWICGVSDQVGDNYTVEIRPGLRRAAAALTPLAFGRPLCEMRLVQDANELVRRLDEWTPLTMQFVEVF